LEMRRQVSSISAKLKMRGQIWDETS
jgi:hypothetical protein